MITGFAVTVALCSLAVAAWSFVLAARARTPGRPVLVGLGVVEALLVAQVVIAVVLMFVQGAPEHLATFIGYLIASVVAVPIGAAWSLAERSRSSTAVLGVVCIAVPVIVLRMHVVWGATGA